MNHKLKRVGVGLIAILALSLVPASISAAAQFTASTYPASFEGTGAKGTGTFKTEAGTVDCKGTASGLLTEASSTLIIQNVTATSCTAFGFITATVHINACYSVVHVNKKINGDAYTGPSDLECPEGASIVTTASTCEMKVFPQKGTVTLEYKNNTEKGYVESKAISSNVTYSVTKDGLGCPFSGTGVKTGGEIIQHEWSPVKREGGGTTSVSGE
jgi:hypothetical protein